MNRSWKKLGLIYCPSSERRHPKLISHAANPVAVHMEHDIYRIFFSGRDLFNRSSIGAIDFDFNKYEIVHEHSEPFFQHGAYNSFYADGVSIGNAYKNHHGHYMLFMGWQNPVDGHWRGDIGRLNIKKDFTLTLDTETPFIASDEFDPISFSYPWVLQNSITDYEMWYGSTISWDAGNGEMLHVIKHAISKDGNEWQRHGLSIPYEMGIAQAFSRPSVVKSKRRYDMWFSYRGAGDKYKIGYAYNIDGKKWHVDLNELVITPSKSGWDSEMVEYPFVFDHKDQRYMLYNGNAYGKTGFGLAILV